MAVALLPGILLSTHPLDLRRRSAVLLFVTTLGVGHAIGWPGGVSRQREVDSRMDGGEHLR